MRLAQINLNILTVLHRRWDAEEKANFNPLQHRIPVNNPHGGRWARQNQGGVPYTGRSSETRTRMPAGAQRHHYIARQVIRSVPLSAEARQIFIQATTEPLRSGLHNRSRGHRGYNAAVGAELTRFLAAERTTAERMTAAQAHRFVGEIMNSRVPAIHNFNMSLYRAEMLYLLNRRFPFRGSDR